MYTILSKSEGVPFQISFFWGDLTWNDPIAISVLLAYTFGTILDHLDINVTLPKFKKTFKTHILADNFTYIVVLFIHKSFVFTPSIYYSFLFDSVHYL